MLYSSSKSTLSYVSAVLRLRLLHYFTAGFYQLRLLRACMRDFIGSYIWSGRSCSPEYLSLLHFVTLRTTSWMCIGCLLTTRFVIFPNALDGDDNYVCIVHYASLYRSSESRSLFTAVYRDNDCCPDGFDRAYRPSDILARFLLPLDSYLLFHRVLSSIHK
jgi:hypothetical protein